MGCVWDISLCWYHVSKQNKQWAVVQTCLIYLSWDKRVELLQITFSDACSQIKPFVLFPTPVTVFGYCHCLCLWFRVCNPFAQENTLHKKIFITIYFHTWIQYKPIIRRIRAYRRIPIKLLMYRRRGHLISPTRQWSTAHSEIWYLWVQ